VGWKTAFNEQKEVGGEKVRRNSKCLGRSGGEKGRRIIVRRYPYLFEE